jgi:hypothetical protein
VDPVDPVDRAQDAPGQLDQVRPAYGTASLAEVLPGALAALGLAPAGAGTDPLDLAGRLPGVRRIAVLLVDGLGYEQLPLAARVAPVVADAMSGRLGELRALTAAFPSTTPTSLATLGTGAPPGAHGLLGFTVREPGSGRVLNHIDWSGDPDPLRWQPLPTQLESAVAAGAAVSVAARAEYAGSGLTRSAWRGGGYRPADDFAGLAGQLLAALTGDEPPVLACGYLPDLDQAGHRFGVGSAAWRAAAGLLDRLLERLVDGLPRDAALLVTADHGQLDVPASHRFDLAADQRLRAGVTVVAGEPRVRYLHTRPGAAADVIDTWRGVLGPGAWVAGREEAVAGGWFGPVPAAHLDRIGDVVVACRDRYAVLASGIEAEPVGTLVAYHGSWTAAEMRVPLLVIRGEGAVGPPGWSRRR